jgi:AraC-like DNA-binding protein
MAKRASQVLSVEDRLRRAGVAFDRLENVPPRVVREAMREVTPNTRLIELPPATIRNSLGQPLLGDLLVTRIGFEAHSAGHYIPRPEGSLDHILIHCVSGSGWLEMGGKRWKAGADTVLCIPAGTAHSYGADAAEPWSIYWLHVTGSRAPDYFHFVGEGIEGPLVHVPHMPELLEAFEATWAAMKAVHTPENLVQASMRAIFYFGLLRHFVRSRDPRGQASEKAIRQSIAFMNKNLGASTSLAELARSVGMSVRGYTEFFRKTTNCSPKEYFNRLKVQKACELLRTGERKVREIALELGFEDPYYFSRIFKRVAGMSPEKFRSR